MKDFKCPNCGAAYDPSKYKCEYCGSFVIMSEAKQFNVPEATVKEMTQEAANTPGIYVFGTLLGKGEVPLRLGLANYYTSKFLGVGGKLLLTKSNLYFTSHTVFQEKVNLCINLLDITSVTQDRNLIISQHISVHTNDNKYTFVVYGGKEWIRMINEAMQAPEAPGATINNDYTLELMRLKKLLDNGVLTEEEFAIKKRMLLGI